VRDHNESKLHLLYEKYLEVELAKRTSQMEAERLSKIYFMVEDRLKGVKSLLPEEKFKRVLKSCVQEEIKKICGLPDFNAWQEQSITKKI